MINLKAFINNMKLTWFGRVILLNSPWQSVMNNTINFNELLVFGRCYSKAIQNQIKINFGLMYYMHTQIFSNLLVKTLNICSFKNSEYDQEIPQSQTAENPVAPRGRAVQPSRDTRKTI